MRTIYKYDVIKLAERDRGSVIEGHITQILCAQVQHNSIMVWAEIDTDAPIRRFDVAAVGTGWQLDPPAGHECVLDSHKYLDTLQFMDGNLVLHIYIKELTPATVKNKPTEPIKANKGELKIEFKPKEATFTGVAMINPEVLAKFV